MVLAKLLVLPYAVLHPLGDLVAAQIALLVALAKRQQPIQAIRLELGPGRRAEGLGLVREDGFEEVVLDHRAGEDSSVRSVDDIARLGSLEDDGTEEQALS